MIRLKTLLLEVDVAPKLNVLFVGDHQVKSNWSFARQLIKDGFITGRIAGWTNATTNQIARIVKANVTKRYDVVVIMGGDADGKQTSPNSAIANLERAYTAAKKYGAKVIAISNPSKIYLQQGDRHYSETMYPTNDIIADWVNTQSISDETIDASRFGEDAFTNDHYRLNQGSNRILADQVKSAIISFGLKPRNKKAVSAADTSLRLGDTGPEVSELHEKLKTLGIDVFWTEVAMSTYGFYTAQYVSELQKRSNIPVTGIYDSETSAVLDRLIASKESTETDVTAGTTTVMSGNALDFFETWKDAAIQQMKKYGVPASITLAQAALESGWGKSTLSTKYNNYFGITGAYNGKSVKLKNKKGQLFTWRVYNSPEESFKDHSDLLKRKYQPSIKDATYEDWAETLTARGYAESNYGDVLIKMIKQYNLDAYDSETASAGTKLGFTGNLATYKPQPSNVTGKNGYLTPSQLKSIGDGHRLAPAAADAYLAMKQASIADGLKDSDWKVSDSYRPYAVQDAWFDWELYKKTGKKKKLGTNGKIAIAYPGTSNHGLGLAIDIEGKSQNWIRKNGEQYGWSWDEGRSVGEPWHFRYKL